MPNWCSNTLRLGHEDSERVRAAVDAFRAGRFLEHFVPLPNGEWNYDFCVANWGTKWDVSGEVVEHTDREATFYFDSAWSPPIAAYSVMAALGFDIVGYYHEPGMAFCGKYVADEESDFDDYYEYGSETSDTVRSLIGAELDDMWAISESMEEWEQTNNDAVTEEELEQELDEIRKLKDADDAIPHHTD